MGFFFLFRGGYSQVAGQPGSASTLRVECTLAERRFLPRSDSRLGLPPLTALGSRTRDFSRRPHGRRNLVTRLSPGCWRGGPSEARLQGPQLGWATVPSPSGLQMPRVRTQQWPCTAQTGFPPHTSQRGREGMGVSALWVVVLGGHGHWRRWSDAALCRPHLSALSYSLIGPGVGGRDENLGALLRNLDGAPPLLPGNAPAVSQVVRQLPGVKPHGHSSGLPARRQPSAGEQEGTS